MRHVCFIIQDKNFLLLPDSGMGKFSPLGLDPSQALCPTKQSPLVPGEGGSVSTCRIEDPV